MLAVLLLFPFHTSRVFDTADPFYVKSQHLWEPLNNVLWFISVWHMQLLFLLAGASTFYALGKRSAGKYGIERVKRLLVPLVFGILVLMPPQTWVGGQFNSGYAGSYWHYLTSGDFLVMNIQESGDYFGGFGVGHFWFILFLFVLSLIALPLFAWGRTERGARTMRAISRGLARPAWWLLPPLVIMLAEGLPAVAGKNLFYYLVFFLLGYVVVAGGTFAPAAERYRWPALITGIGLSLWWILTGDLRESLADPSLALAGLNYLGMLATWSMLTAFFGLGRRYLDRPGSFAQLPVRGVLPPLPAAPDRDRRAGILAGEARGAGAGAVDLRAGGLGRRHLRVVRGRAPGRRPCASSSGCGRTRRPCTARGPPAWSTLPAPRAAGSH